MIEVLSYTTENCSKPFQVCLKFKNSNAVLNWKKQIEVMTKKTMYLTTKHK